ncbi:hypothetical protein AGR1B_pTi0154 [Agrobacterium fabacearum S56]|nr:hypothetical protein AGR1B_pTi0154 [Agrobacterium fabacearum S56]
MQPTRFGNLPALLVYLLLNIANVSVGSFTIKEKVRLGSWGSLV